MAARGENRESHDCAKLSEREKGIIDSVERAGPGGRTAEELGEAIGLNKKDTQKIAQELADRGLLVERDTQEYTYHLSAERPDGSKLNSLLWMPSRIHPMFAWRERKWWEQAGAIIGLVLAVFAPITNFASWMGVTTFGVLPESTVGSIVLFDFATSYLIVLCLLPLLAGALTDAVAYELRSAR
jgi:hypothetical protein